MVQLTIRIGFLETPSRLDEPVPRGSDQLGPQEGSLPLKDHTRAERLLSRVMESRDDDIGQNVTIYPTLKVVSIRECLCMPYLNVDDYSDRSPCMRMCDPCLTGWFVSV